jgi:hypothetical protein
LGRFCRIYCEIIPLKLSSFFVQACSFGYGEQMNQINHLLDGSVVYGNDDEDAKALR